MTPEELATAVKKKATELKTYTESRFPVKAGNIAMRFVNGNFRAQGFQGATFKKWKENSKGTTILVKTGKLRASTYFTTQIGQFTIKNHMKYAKFHNEGFKGKISVKAHKRNRYSQSGRQTMKRGQGSVKAHERSIDMPARQFIPTAQNPSPILNRRILKMIDIDIQQIMI